MDQGHPVSLPGNLCPQDHEWLDWIPLLAAECVTNGLGLGTKSVLPRHKGEGGGDSVVIKYRLGKRGGLRLSVSYHLRLWPLTMGVGAVGTLLSAHTWQAREGGGCSFPTPRKPQAKGWSIDRLRLEEG